MRAIVQRVNKAQVNIDGKVHSKIDKGLLVFIGVTHDDTDKDIDYMVKKICGLRIFNDEEGKMNLSLKDVDGQIMIVSQFTLYGDVRRGFRPSFTQSASGDLAIETYEKFVDKVKDQIPLVKTGVFGADMKISLINDGPVTIQLESKKLY